MSKISLIITFLLLSMFLINSACLLDKINTQLIVFGEYDDYLEKLDVETQLSYVNLDTAKKNPLPGQDLKIVVNITYKYDENVIEERIVTTNQMGWARRTFYDLSDIKEYDVKVYYEGSGIYKDSIGTIGGGVYDTQEYTTNMPEGISLTVCMPVLLLMGFLGAAMYASGGNPFGFVDLTTSRGFRMNRNLRKTMFSSGIIWTGIATGMMVGENIIRGIAKARGKEDVHEGSSGEGTKGEGKETGDGKVLGATGHSFNKRSVQDQNKKQEVNIKGQNQISRTQKAFKSFAPTSKRKGFFAFAKIFMIVSSLFTGRQFTSAKGNKRHSTDIAADVYERSLNEEKSRIYKENMSLNEKIMRAKHIVENTEKERINIQAEIDGNNMLIKSLNEQLEKTKDEKGKKVLSQYIQNLQNHNNSLMKEMNGLDNNFKQAKEILKIVEQIKGMDKKGLEERLGELDVENINIATIHAMKNALNEIKDMDKDERKKLESTLNKMENQISNTLEIQTNKLERVEFDEQREKIMINEKITEEQKNDMITRMENERFTEDQMVATYIVNSEDYTTAIEEVSQMKEYDEKYMEERNKLYEETKSEVIKTRTEEIKQRERDLEIIYGLIENPEEYEKMKATDDESRIFNEEYQRSVLRESSFGDGRSGDTIQDRINKNKQIRAKYEEELKNESYTTKQRDIIRGEMEKEISRNNDNGKRFTEYQLKEERRLIEAGQISPEEVIRSLNPEKKGFSDNWETYERAREARTKRDNIREKMGLTTYNEGRDTYPIIDIEIKINNHIKNKIDNGILSREVVEVAKQYDILKKSQEISSVDRKYDADGEIGNKILKRINEEINTISAKMEEKIQRGARTTTEMNKIEKLEERKASLEENLIKEQADDYLSRRRSKAKGK